MFYIISDLLRENFTKHALAKRAKEILPAFPIKRFSASVTEATVTETKKVRKKFSSRDFGLLNLGRLWETF